MKSILVNVEIQFDMFEDDANVEKYVMEQLNNFNSTLQQMHPDVCPQLFANNIPAEDIEVAEQE